MRPLAMTVVVASIIASAVPAGAAPGDLAWHSEVDGTAHSTEDSGADVLVSPAGDVVFVAGSKDDASSGMDGFVVAYGASTGQVLWQKRFDGPAHKDDWFSDAELAPNGDVLYVRGGTSGGDRGSDVLVVAYSAGSGKRLWASVFRGPKKSKDGSDSMAVDLSGKRVYIGGWGSNVGGYVAAFSASGGPPLWSWKAKGYSWIFDVAAAPNGRVLAAGKSDGDAFVGAFRGKTGAKLWAASAAGSAGDTLDFVEQVVVSPNGAEAFAVGKLENGATGVDALFMKVHVATGDVPWFKVHDTGGGADDRGRHVVVSSDGSTVFITESHSSYPTSSWEVRSYAAADGAEGWTTSDPGEYIESIVIGSDGDLYTAGGNGYGCRLTKYASSTGVTGWSTIYPMSSGYVNALAVAPDVQHAFITGTANGDATTASLATG